MDYRPSSYGVARARYKVADPPRAQRAALAARLTRTEALWQRCRHLLRWSFAALLFASAALLLEALLDAFARWPGQ